MKILPLFKSHYSTGKSILTLKEYSKKKPENIEPDSAVQIAKEAGLDTLTLVEDSMGGYMEAYTNCKKAGIKLIFGVKFSFVNEWGSEDESETEHKNIVFAKNEQGYRDLIRFYTEAKTTHHDKYSRVDYKIAESLWTDNLLMGIPFYDSFIYNNNLTLKTCIPTWFTEPFVFLESNDLPLDKTIRDKASNWAEFSGFKTVEAKTIYYKNRDDYRAWVTFKCITNRKGNFGKPPSLEMPNLDGCCSNEFCMESWKEANES